MANTEVMNLKAALEAKRLELAAQLSRRIRELTIEDGQHDPFDWIQSMSDRDEIAVMLNQFSSTLADVERSLRAINENSYGNCVCVRCREQFEAGEEEGSVPQWDGPRAA